MERTCKQCQIAKPLEAFYRDKRSEDGRDFYCKECRDGRGAALRARRRDARPEKPTHRPCRQCGVVCPVAEFPKGRRVCRACYLDQRREYESRPEVAAKLKEQEFNRRSGKWKRPPRREPIGPGFEVCTMCNEDKPLDQFFKHRLGRNGTDSACKDCKRVISQNRRRDPAVREREQEQKDARVFNLRPGQYNEMLESQGRGCAICGKPRNGSRLHVDHDHATGAVRGLLCNTCNAGLGSFRDDPNLMLAAVEYLRSHGK